MSYVAATVCWMATLSLVSKWLITIAGNTASNRAIVSDHQRLYGNTIHRSGDHQQYMETLFSDRAIVGDRKRSYASVIPAIWRSWAIQKYKIQLLLNDNSPSGLFSAMLQIIKSKYKLNITGLRIPTCRRQTCWLLTSVAEDLKPRFSVKQIQLAVRVGLELGSSGLQVQHSNGSATPPPTMIW